MIRGDESFLDEVRNEAESLESECAFAGYQALAGHREDPGFTDIYSRHERLASPAVFGRVLGHLEAASGGEHDRLSKLVEHLASVAEGAASREIEDRISVETSTRTVVVRGTAIALRTLPVRIRNTTSREVRAELQAAEQAALAELGPLYLDRLATMREAATRLVPGDYVAAKSSLSGIDLEHLAEQADRFLERTRDLCRDAVVHQRKLCPDVPGTGRLAAHDLARLHRGDAHDRLFPPAEIWSAVDRSVRAMGLDPLAGGRITLDLEERPTKSARAFCAARRVPEEVYLVVRPSGGAGDWRTTLHELGHAVHRANTDAEAPFENRWLGDASVTEGYAILFDRLVMNALWLRRAAGISKHDVEAPLRQVATSNLLTARRHAAKLRYEIDLHRGASDLPARYRERISGALGVDWPGGSHAADVDTEFYCARYLRAWMLEAILHRYLRERFDEDWFRNPRAGPFLAGLFSEGQRRDATAIARDLAGLELEPGALAQRFEEVLV